MPYFQFQNIKISAMTAAVPTREVKIDSLADVFGEEQLLHRNLVGMILTQNLIDAVFQQH